MTHTCLKCGQTADKSFRLVLGSGRMERLCQNCSEVLSTLVRTAGDTCQLSMGDQRFLTWLETGQWPTRDGRFIQLDGPPGNQPSKGAQGRHRSQCPCCSTLAEEEEI